MIRSLLLAAGVAASAAVPVWAADELATATVEKRSVPREYRLDGTVEAVNRGTITSQTQGEVLEIHYDVDDVVEKGSLMIRLKDTEQRAQVAQAAAQLKSAAARLEQSRDEHKRVSGLFKKKNASESAMDKAEADLAAAQAQQDAALAGLEQAQEQLAYTTIKAPYSGIVTTRHVEVGELARQGAPLITGISLNELRVLVDVPQSVISAVRELGEANVYVGDTIITPKKITIFPVADAGSNTFIVRLELPEGTEGLFPGMFVKTGFVTGKREQLVVPRDAVVYRSEVTGVYTLDDEGRIRFRQVRVGRQIDDHLVVLSGLSEGERVALDPIAAGVVLKQRLEAARKDGDKHHG